MNGLIVVYKEKGCTSRDVVNQVSRILETKKVGHIGTLDPMATGVLVLCVGNALKLVELLMEHDKEYIATVKLGIETDTLDITGEVLETKEVSDISLKRVEEVLKSFLGKSMQEVPKYSAIKVNGKKLYEYARNDEDVVLPKKEIEVSSIELVSDIIDNTFTFKCSVSKGTYIRSLVRDIGYKLGTVATMVELERTRLGKFLLEDSYTVDDILNGDYQLLDISDVLDLPVVVVDSILEKKILNGCVLDKFFDEDMVVVKNTYGELIAIYKKKDDNKVKPYRMFC